MPKTETPAHWVTPQLVAEVTFTEWTRDGSMRHPVFVALRSDKPASEVVRERALPVEERPARASKGRAARTSKERA